MRLGLIPSQQQSADLFLHKRTNNKRMIIAPKQKNPFFGLISLLAFVVVVAHTLLAGKGKR